MYTTGAWDDLEPEQRDAWVSFIQSFQVEGNPLKIRIGKNALLDPVLVKFSEAETSLLHRLFGRFLPRGNLTWLEAAVLAETKQSIATLAQVGVSATHHYGGLPATVEEVKTFVRRLDWRRPWGAGGRASGMMTLLVIEGGRSMDGSSLEALLKACVAFFDSLVDAATGTYFSPGTVASSHGEMINGAMKVLTALDWLGAPIHLPERLIDTCLSGKPVPSGCHLVDAVYVLYRCLQQTQYRKPDIQSYCIKVLEMVREHHNDDGGFSYSVGKSQTDYYRLPISQGRAESDIHATCLLTWALAMLFQIIGYEKIVWKVIKP